MLCLAASINDSALLLCGDRTISEEYAILPEAATSAMGLFVTFAMKPTIEKITKPANMLVHELMQHTMIESLGERKYKIGLLSKI